MPCCQGVALPPLSLNRSRRRRWPPFPCAQFPHTPYGGHHKELGLNAIEFVSAQDCWVRDVRIVNADNGVLVYDVSDESHSGSLGRAASRYSSCNQPSGADPGAAAGSWAG